MFPQVLALTESWPFIVGSLPFIMMIVLIVMLTWYFMNKKRLEHQQILAAIEKNIPLSELIPVKQKGADWIRSLTAGIAFLLMGIGMAIIPLISSGYSSSDKDVRHGLFIASVVFLAFGAASIVRGILQQKAEKALSSDKSAT